MVSSSEPEQPHILKKTTSEPGPKSAAVRISNKPSCLRRGNSQHSLTSRHSTGASYSSRPPRFRQQKVDTSGDGELTELRSILRKASSDPTLSTPALVLNEPTRHRRGVSHHSLSSRGVVASSQSPRSYQHKTAVAPRSAGSLKRRSLLVKTSSEPAFKSSVLLALVEQTSETHSTKRKKKPKISSLEHRVEKMRHKLNTERYDAELSDLMKEALRLNNDQLKNKLRKKQLTQKTCRALDLNIQEGQEKVKKYSAEIKLFRKSQAFHDKEYDRLSIVLSDLVQS